MSARLSGLIAVLVCVVGCQGSDEAPAKAPVLMNPSGKPQNEAEAKIAAGQQRSGQAAEKQMAAAAAAMKAAQGGK